jgi:hypothetical protein
VGRLPAALPRFDSPPDLGVARCSDGPTASACGQLGPRGQRCLVDALYENREIEVDYMQSKFDVVARFTQTVRAAADVDRWVAEHPARIEVNLRESREVHRAAARISSTTGPLASA